MRTTTLPPDPERMNDRRAAWAEQAVYNFTLTTGADREDALSDLRCDLMHWCDRNGLLFDDELDRARNHYEAETTTDDQPEEGE